MEVPSLPEGGRHRPGAASHTLVVFLCELLSEIGEELDSA